ncbi:uncharacterized protein LOC107003644 [Solanum pennellii]|uniref:Uncharacterized protein LOC107003644 n=1 Tax=Solanum pennellii TaxID=28526 RepID=A0ABM1FIT9_SOLPN|nr:uncharacterized protein LOC107003644 [Solanum pennellii]
MAEIDNYEDSSESSKERTDSGDEESSTDNGDTGHDDDDPLPLSIYSNWWPGKAQSHHRNPVSPDDPEYQQWAQKDSMVLSWIIENIDGDLIYDLNTKATSMKQGIDTIEVYFSKLNTLWKEIDRRMPNPMKCAEDITLFNSFIQRQRLYQFLAGVNDSLDKEKRDILNLDPLTTIDAAYATIRREIARRGIMTGNSSLGRGPSEIGSGLVTQRRSDSSSRREDKTHLKCSHCGGTKHTKEGCFKLIGYPEWWEDLRQRKAATKVTKTGGKANAAIGEGEPTSEDSSTTVTDRRTGTSGKDGFTKFFGEPWMKTEESTERRNERVLEESSFRNDGCSDGADHWSWY